MFSFYSIAHGVQKNHIVDQTIIRRPKGAGTLFVNVFFSLIQKIVLALLLNFSPIILLWGLVKEKLFSESLTNIVSTFQ